jgi:hypothetical protein
MSRLGALGRVGGSSVDRVDAEQDVERHWPRATTGTVVDVAAWLVAAAESVEGIDQWAAKMFARDPILLNHICGPAGPVYQAVNGIHRVHAARIWRLPYVLAIVHVEKLPTPIGPGPAGDLSQLWEGLQQRGLIEADVVGQYWYLRSATAEWMLMRPSLATVMNFTYERLYSGALQKATRMTIHELTEPKKWERALTRGRR